MNDPAAHLQPAAPGPHDLAETPCARQPDPVPVPDAGRHWVDRTDSRRLRRASDFLDAVRWAVSAALHPRANAATVRVAEDLAGRLNSAGQVAYGRDRVAARLGMCPRSVAYHVRYLRELGLLVWAVRGSRANARRARGLPGYAATATLYAACAPPQWDAAMGRRVAGTGYWKRVCGVTAHGRRRAVREAARRCSPSFTRSPLSGKAEVGRGRNYTTGPATAAGRRRRAPSAGTRRESARVAADVALAARIRPRVAWTQGTQLRRLAHALRPLIDAGLDAEDIVCELTAWWVAPRPRDAAAFIRARLARRPPPAPGGAAVCAAGPDAPEPVPPNAEFRAAVARLTHRREEDEVPGCLREDPRALAAWQAVRIRERILASLAGAEQASRERRFGGPEGRSLGEWLERTGC